MDIKQIKDDLRGPGALILATFDQDFSLNVKALEQNVGYLVDQGMRRGKGFLIAPCGIGEMVALDPQEHRKMVEVAILATGGELPVVAGITAYRYQEAIELAENASEAGAICAMVAPPYYRTASEDMLYEWYRILAESFALPIMVYDHSFRNMPVNLALLERYSHLPQIVACKYPSPGNYDETFTAWEKYGNRFAFYDNSFGYATAFAHMHGAPGYINPLCLCWPELELEFWDLMEAGNYLAAHKHHAPLAAFWDYRNSKTTTLPDTAIFKAALEYVGLYGGPLRPPYRELSPGQKEELFAVLDKIDRLRTTKRH